MVLDTSDNQMTPTQTLYRPPHGARHYIIADDLPPAFGPMALVSISGEQVNVDPIWAAAFEVTPDQANAWAREQLGDALSQLRQAADAKLAAMRAGINATNSAPAAPGSPYTPDAVPALAALAKTLPGAVLDALSADPARVIKANGVLAGIERRLGQAGVDTGTRLAEFPFRLATLRREFAEAARTRSS